MTRYKGMIVLDGDARQSLSSLSVALFHNMALLDQPGFVEVRVPVSDAGDYAIEIGDDARDDKKSRLAVIAPTGEVVQSTPLADLLGDDASLKKIKLPRGFVPPPVAPRPEAPAGSPQRVTGRLFRAGDATAGKTEIRLYGLPEEGDRFPIFAGQTDASGYFSGTTAAGVFRAVEAEVGTAATALRVPVAAPDGILPQPVLLIDERAAEADAHDCACAAVPPAVPDADELAREGASFSTDLGGNCADFTVPNRTLEEFTFFKIVRTTDPQIRGLTMPDGVRDTGLTGALFDATFSTGAIAKLIDAGTQTRSGSLPGDGGERVAMAMRMARGDTSKDSGGTLVEEAPIVDTPVTAYLDTSALETAGVASAARWNAAFDARGAEGAVREALSRIEPATLEAALADPDGFTPVHLMMLERRAQLRALKAYLDWRWKSVSGRGALTESNPVDWDETPEFYQATTVAHGHILTFKQEWKADGYSLGELIKSLPLAPGQKKQIAILDWDRGDVAARNESSDSAESLVADLSHERDINEIANAAFHEDMNGGSRASNEAIGGGIGFAIGPLVIGGGGGASKASSSAWQDSSREMSGSTLNQLRDSTSQGASAVRSQRSTVIETSGQRERVGATTEVIANHNRCHAMTIQYFEVLRHFAVQERLAGVRECLFVPLRMSLFDAAKALRWRSILTRTCRKPALRRNFESVQRLSSPSTTPPNRSFADDPVEEMSGTLSFRLSITRPKDPDDAGKVEVEATAWRLIARLLGVSPQALYERYRRNDAKKDQIYREEIAPEAARKYLESLQIALVDRDGNTHDAGFGITILSQYAQDGIMQIALNDQGASPRLTRRDIVGIEISTDYELPEFSKAVLEGARVDYRTERMAYWLVRDDRVLDDVQAGDGALLSTSALTAAEERNQLKEDRQRQRVLIKHLNANIEYYHRAIWLNMDANRRYMLLDGFEAPGSGGRSVASVVENRVIGVVGNALAMPVSPGHQLDPVLRAALKEEDDPEKVLSNLYDVAPVPPRRHSVPTKGVFAEAMMGKCDSCEVIEEDRFWRWTNYPLPDSPPPIAPLSTATRYAAPGDMTPTAFPAALVGFQTIPNAPAPTGMAAALGLLGKNVFKDLTGLTENQKNAMAALTTALSSSEAFAGEAFQLSMAEQASRNLDRTIDQIATAKQAGYLTDEEASGATRDALLSALGKPKEGASDEVTKVPAVEKAVEKAATTPGGSAVITRSVGDGAERVAFTGGEAGDLTIGAATSPHVLDLPDIWLSTPLIQDSLVAGGGVSEIKRTRDIADARVLYARTLGSGSSRIVWDQFESARAAGLVRADPADPTKVQLKTRVRAGYLANAANKAQLAAAPGSAKLPVVVIVHGQAPAWEPIAPETQTGTNSAGVPIIQSGIDSISNHAGYDYLQLFMAETGRQIATFSVETNAANALNALVDMRAEMLLDTIQAIRDAAADPASPFHERLDFDNVGLVGHSRGGEAITRAIELNAARPAAKRLGIKALCSLAPTDFRGSDPVLPPSIPPIGDISYLVVHGGLDGDVSGVRTPGQVDFGGTGMRHYDRAKVDKVVAWIPAAIHDFFNTVWNVANEWASPPGIPAGALSAADHRALGKDYIGQFFDMVLNRDATVRPLFDNRQANSVGAPVALSWKFGVRADVDDFQGSRSGRGALPAEGSVEALADVAPPIVMLPTHRQLHTPHISAAYILDVSSAVSAISTLEEGFSPPADISHLGLLTFRLGVMYPDTTTQALVDAITPPKFEVQLQDKKGAVNVMASDAIYADLANGWAPPKLKTIDGTDATQMVMQTITVDIGKLMTPYFGNTTAVLPINTAELVALRIAFQMPALASEIWVDDICFINR